MLEMANQINTASNPLNVHHQRKGPSRGSKYQNSDRSEQIEECVKIHEIFDPQSVVQGIETQSENEIGDDC